MNNATRVTNTPRDQVLLAATGLWAALIVGLAIFQTWQYYSPVPVWDMWDGYLEFYEKASAGDWSVWWAQHNEHRLFLARLLFWADIRWFHGMSIFLLVADYVLLSLIALTFWIILSNQLARKLLPAGALIGLFLTAWLFLLCQGENLTWAFQGQFYFTFLIPLCAFYWLHKSSQTAGIREFLVACTFGVLAAGAMANGILVLPLMTVYAIFIRQLRIRIASLVVLALAVMLLYFHGYRSPGGHSLFAPEITNHLGNALLFVLTLLGNPFSFVLGQPHNLLIARVFGVLFILGNLYKAAETLRSPKRTSPDIALLFFNLYIIVSAIGVMGGRLAFGLNLALTPHYTTPAIMGWTSLTVLYARDLTAMKISWQRCAAIGAIVMAIFMTNFQIKSLFRSDDTFFDRKVAILGLSLGIDDQERTRILTDPPSFRMIPPIAEKAYTHRLSIFGRYPFRGSRASLLQPQSQPGPLPTCQGSLDGIETTTDQRFVRLSGWIANPAGTREPLVVRMLSEPGNEVGYGITGRSRPDLGTAKMGTFRPGFSGYAAFNATGTKIVLQGEDRHGPICRMSATMPAVLFSYRLASVNESEVTLDSSNILPSNGWIGGDAFHTNLCSYRLRIYGSFMRGGDADSGSISLRIKRGDRVLYRSGPTGGHQILEIAGHPPIMLPLAIEWVDLDFSSLNLPTQEFVAELHDAGTGWGEWSAIAVRDVKPCQ